MSNNRQYRHNHYVPEWYQRRFLLKDQSKYFYLDLKPEVCVRNGHRFARKSLRELGPSSCFAQNDLYTTKWGEIENTDIEKVFFGGIDAEGKEAVEFFSSFSHPSVDGEAYQNLI